MRPFGAATQQKDDGVSTFSQINAVSRAEVNAKLSDAVSHLLYVAEVTEGEAVDSGDDLCLGVSILEPSLPLLKDARLPDFKHQLMVV